MGTGKDQVRGRDWAMNPESWAEQVLRASRVMVKNLDLSLNVLERHWAGWRAVVSVMRGEMEVIQSGGSI